MVEPESDNRFEWNDSIVMDRVIETFTSLPSPACVMAITISGHIPFDSSPDDIPIPDSVPALFRHYMQTAHYTDRQIGRLLNWADTAEVMQNSTIVITGDHRIFHAWLNDETREFGVRANLPFGTGQAGCPLIIVSPRMETLRIIEQAEQIDIFPTILDFIGQKNYFWKGFGRDLREENIPVENGNYQLHRSLSDKLIRTNYFK
jgi:phosphoglycerol transferase MdoB-like AlkP superfamily enzyme